jgi:hypothetical protein
MDTSHLVTSVETEEIDTGEIYDEEEIQASINEILGASSSIQESSEDWMHSVSELVTEATENYFSAASDYINGDRYVLEEEAEHMAHTMHQLDQSLEVLSMRTGVTDQDYRNRLLEVKNRLEDEVIAPLTAAALEKGDFTSEIRDEDVDYLLRPVRDNYIGE